MNTKDLTLAQDLRAFFIPSDADKDVRYRLGRFVDWLQGTGRSWTAPELAVYRDAMLSGELGTAYASGTVSAHLGTIRARYRNICRDNGTRDRLYVVAGERYDQVSDRKAFVDEVLVRLANAADARQSKVDTLEKQDVADGEHLRLTKVQADAFLAAPGVTSLGRLRDTAAIAVMLCTGVREAELSQLEVRDLRQHLGGKLALHVRNGKGGKARLVPYGAQEWVLAIVDRWLAAVGIDEGPVFRGFYKGYKRLRPDRLSVRAIADIVGSYPVMVDGELVRVKPHDLRRTYARRSYEEGMDLVAIQQNLGHRSLETTLRYIGELDADCRCSPALYSFDLGVLDRGV